MLNFPAPAPVPLIRVVLLSIFTCLLAPPSAWATTESLDQRLQAFRENPQAFLEALPKKKSLSGQPSLAPFSRSEVASKKFIEAKNQHRAALSGRSSILANDKPQNIVDHPREMIVNIEEMQKKKLLKGEVAVAPWSDYYWPLYNGQIAYRYADESFPADSTDWKKKSDFFLSSDAKNSAIDDLSPAEKYDLLVGDDHNTLTQKALAEGEIFYRASGKVETWMGICHGWAPAAYMMDRPTHAVNVLAADGKTKITFYPSDIKALASLLWATNAPVTRSVGGRCNTKNPKKDKNGRVKDQDCFDTNPGAWHQAVVNQVGLNKRSFVMDATFDYEVWNQPLSSYSYTYFNPQTLKPSRGLKDAMVEIKDFSEDRFKNYRGAKAKYVVGISMDVNYVVETEPQHKKTDSPADDAITQVSYEYDLELDENLNIVGGEWYLNAHPDFLWTAPEGSRARTIADEAIEENWDVNDRLPDSWKKLAPRASEAGSPLAAVVETLVELSAKSSRR